MSLHNSHILKFYRLQIFMAKGRPMAQTFWIQWHNDELERSA